MIPGQVVEVRVEARGSILLNDLSAGTSGAVIEDPTPFDDAGGQVKIGDTIYTYGDVTEFADPTDADNTNGLMLLTSAAVATETAGTPVVLWSGSQVLDDVILVVDVGDDNPIDVYVDSSQRKDWVQLAGGVDPPVAVLLAPDLSKVTDAPGYTPPTRLEAASVSSLYPNGAEAARFGPYTASQETGYGFFLNTETGAELFGAVRYPGLNMAAFQIRNMDQVLVSGGSVTLTDPTFAVSLDVSSEGIALSHPTTSSAANAYLNPATNRIGRSTSSRRYKQDIEDADVDPAAVLRMQPRTWRDRLEVEADPDTENTHIGFIAEELDDIGLGVFVTRDAEGDPEAIAYDRLTVALLALAKSQQQQLDDLRTRVDALDERNA